MRSRTPREAARARSGGPPGPACRSLALLRELVPYGLDPGNSARQVGGACLELRVGDLANQGHDAVVGAHLDAGLLEPVLPVETRLDRLRELLVLRVDRR